MKVSKVSYLIRKRMGEYEYEELSAEVLADTEVAEDPDTMMRLARATCVKATTQYLQKEKNK